MTRHWHVRALAAALGGLALVLQTNLTYATGAPSYDWATYGFDPTRSAYDSREADLGAGNAATLHTVWSTDLLAAIDAQPVIAAGLTVNGVVMDVLYVGTEHGKFYAINAATGTILWSKDWGATQTSCYDEADGIFGIGGSALIQRSTNAVYVAGGDGSVHSLDLVTGNERTGWPVTNVFAKATEHVYSGINILPNGNTIYVTVAGECDIAPYRGKVVAIQTTGTPAITGRFYPAGPSDNGGGIWGPGGVSVGPRGYALFVGTGNSLGNPEYGYYSDQMVLLNANTALTVAAHNFPNVSGFDVDFGSTPVVFTPSGCGTQIALKNKSGQPSIYDQGTIKNGPRQSIQVADPNGYDFNGDVAWNPRLNMLYLANSADNSPYSHGIVAFKQAANCMWTLAWQRTVGTNASSYSPPTIANGVVYLGTGGDNRVYAFNAATGANLWNSASTINGSVYAAPIVDTGRLYVPSWNHVLYAFSH